MNSSLENFCPVLSNKKNLKNKEKCLECLEVEKEWDIGRLLKDLELAKGFIDKYSDWELEEENFRDFKVKCKALNVESKNLNDRETCWLFLFLKGQNVNQISSKFNLSTITVKSIFSQTLYKYFKVVIYKKRISNWAQVKLYLEENGYRKISLPWDIDRLLKDLHTVKKNSECKKLTDQEIRLLHLLLQGLDTEEVSNKLYLSKKTVKSDLSKTLYKYVKELTVH